MQHTQQPATASGTFRIGGDLTVNRLGFGAMRITGEGIWGPPANKQESIAVLRRTIELGINLIDTADAYGPDVSESLIAEALYPYPSGLVIATKGGLTRSGPNQWSPQGSPAHLRAALEGSLRRLRLDRIDVYQFHRPDPQVPFEDSIGELAKLQQEGKIRHIGISNVTIEQLAQARKIVPIVTVQNRYNLANRASDNMTAQEAENLVDICARENIGFIPWFPMNTGDLAHAGSPLDKIAQQHNAQPNQIALAWLLQRSGSILPIPGTSSVKHLEENVIGATIKLSKEEFDTLTQINE